MKIPKLKIHVWKAKDGFRWHMKRCGRIVAESGEGYKRVHACTKALCNIIKSISTANYEYLNFPSTAKK